MEVILVKLGELALKGLNRSSFESVLMKNIRRSAKPYGGAEVTASQSTMTICPKIPDNIGRISSAVSKIFGIAAFSRALMVEKDIDIIMQSAGDYLRDQLLPASTFKVASKRSDKKFPHKSPWICAELGGRILEEFPHLSVDVHNPEITVQVEVRDKFAYIHGKSLPGAGGLPVGTGGRAAIMISGGIDSPVAAWMMAKRGVELTAVHFASPPYTSEMAERKVIGLLDKVSQWAGVIKLHIVPFTQIQEAIRENAPEDFFTVIMRRYMIKIAERIAEQNGCLALISGESLGQVASQTMMALARTDAVASVPILRPLIGMDKEEIVQRARKIDTYELSILPYEDCCTVFTPKHPKTKPTAQQVGEAESNLVLDDLIEEAVSNVRKVWIAPNARINL